MSTNKPSRKVCLIYKGAGPKFDRWALVLDSQQWTYPDKRKALRGAYLRKCTHYWDGNNESAVLRIVYPPSPKQVEPIVEPEQPGLDPQIMWPKPQKFKPEPGVVPTGNPLPQVSNSSRTYSHKGYTVTRAPIHAWEVVQRDPDGKLVRRMVVESEEAALSGQTNWYMQSKRDLINR